MARRHHPESTEYERFRPAPAVATTFALTAALPLAVLAALAAPELVASAAGGATLAALAVRRSR